jgi:hypothetical protein
LRFPVILIFHLLFSHKFGGLAIDGGLKPKYQLVDGLSAPDSP